MELWDLLDKDRNLVGNLHERGKPIPVGFYHLSVHIWIRNYDGKFLMSKRHPNKSFPNYWECTGGAVIAHENSLTGALREVEEELGIKLEAENGQMIMSERRDKFQDFYDVWLFSADFEINDLTYQIDEVVEAKWMSKEEIEYIDNENWLVPTLKYYRDIL